MDNQYITALSTFIEKTKIETEKIHEDNPCEELEDNEVSKSLIALMEKLDDIKNTIKYYSNPTNEGYLVENSSGKYVIKFLNGDSSSEIVCGSNIEVFVNGKGWKAGRTEYSEEKGYYFYNAEELYPKLYTDMKVRIRLIK